MISSVVVRVASEGAVADVAERLATDPRIETGTPLDGGAIPLAIEAETAEEMERAHQWLRTLPGVSFVDVVCVYFDEALTPTRP